jgi:hypothetical protein
MNPYSTHRQWPAETLAAWTDMPKDHNGMTAPAVAAYRDQWRKWFARTDPKLWYPPVLEAFKELDRRAGK